MAVIYGTSGADTKNGTEGNDTIYGWASGGNANSPSGNDTLNGLAGNDNLFGGTGNDSLNGGAALDTLNGGSGSDKLNGGGGNDTYIIDSTTDQVTEAANSGTDTVRSSISYTLGSNLESLTLTGTGALNGTGNNLKNIITGNAANNTLNGRAGGDTLDGGLGIDTLIGGTGSDTYIVDSTTDTIIEYVNGNDFDEAGYTIPDVVGSSVTYRLGNNLERLLLTGSSPINGTGNALENSIEGNDANNSLYGGADNDSLNGGLGSDKLYGGTGDDTYIVDSTTDTITENLDAGVDTVESSFSYTLAANLEDLTLTGAMAINGTGNALKNSIQGNDANNSLYGDNGNDNLIGGDGNDSLYGGAGNDYLLGRYESRDFGDDTVLGEAGDDTLFGGLSNEDTLIGGTGNDRYIIENTLDTITEDLDAGVDTVELNSSSSVSYTLGDNLENLTLTGEGDAIVIGNTLNNFIYGRSSFRGDGNITLNGGLGNDNLVGGIDDDSLDGGTGNDTLDGSPGIDTLTGGAGADTFHFYSPLEGIDTITDFSVVDDTISVDDDEFGGELTVGAAITTDQFVIGSAAADANDRFIYNNNTGVLFFDEDGTGATEQVQFATLPTGLAMTNADIFVITRG